MSTSGGSSGGSAGFPLTGAAGGNTSTIDDPAGVLKVTDYDTATGNFGAELDLIPNAGGTQGTATLAAESAAHEALVRLVSNDPGGAFISLLNDAQGLIIDANGNPAWNGTLPPAPLLVATAHLNAAAIATLFSAPTQIVAAPGAGKAVVVVGGCIEFKAGAIGFSSASSVACFYGTPTIPNQATPTPGGVVPLWGSLGVPVSAIAAVTPVQDGGANESALTRAAVADVPLVFGRLVSDVDRAGPIATATVAAGGLLYAVNDTGTIATDLYVGGATYKVLTVGAGGAVTSFQVTAAGNGYSLIDNPIGTAVGGAQPGLGDGNFAINVTAIPAPDGDLYVTVVYQIITLH